MVLLSLFIYNCEVAYASYHLLKWHYENTPIQIYWKFYDQKKEKFPIKNSNIFHILAHK